MKSRALPIFLVAIHSLLAFGLSAAAEDIGPPLELPIVEASYLAPYYTTVYSQPADPKEGQLQLGVNYTLWIPEGLKQVRGIIVHQHGCGAPAARASVTAAHDLHWQELAKRTQSALLGPSFHQAAEQSCGLWSDPRNGSDKVFLSSLKELAKASGHPEIATVPWCLWGHSGGGSWSSRMQLAYPERIVAIWFQSGTAYGRGDIDASTVSDEVLKIPMMANPGQKEKTHERFHRVWESNLAMFKGYRAKGAPIGFAPDPNTGHETGDSRYLAIPFFEACLQLRLPDQMGEPLKTIDVSQGWLVPVLGTEMPKPATDFKGDATKAVWLPNETVARAWQDFVKTGTVSDSTPPPAPTDVKIDKTSGAITWKAAVDYQSGIQAFIIERDGKKIGQVPEERENHRGGRPLFQGLTHGDTPEILLRFQFVDTAANVRESYEYRVIAVNSAGLRSR